MCRAGLDPPCVPPRRAAVPAASSPRPRHGRAAAACWAQRALALLLLSTSATLPAQGTLSDPTAPPARPSRGSGGHATVHWQLQSTLVGPDRRVAVINDTVLREGESIDGAQLVAIEYSTVLLDVGGRTLRLRLFNAEPAADDPRGNP